MRNYVLITCVGLLSACASFTPIPQEIKDKVAQIPAEDLPRNSSIEQMRCPKSRYPLLDKRMECHTEVRRNRAARIMMNEQKEQAEQNMTKGQDNETIKN